MTSLQEIKTFLENSPTSSLWEKVGIFPHHGFALSLSSLRSYESSGIGEFLDLIPLIDWCKTLSFDILQLLPLNDTGNDPSPYWALSSCALDPVFLRLQELPFLEEIPLLKEALKEFQPLNLTLRVNLQEVKKRKKKWLFDYLSFARKKLEKENGFQNFLFQNPWLKPYALFSALQDTQEGKNWKEWPEKLRSPTEEEKELLIKQFNEPFRFHLCLQYLAFSQMIKVKDYATKKRVFLFGDLPFLISPDSADLWHDRNFFNMKEVAGAPPDLFSPEGQKWGFPLFQWEEMARQGFFWWKERLGAAALCYHLFRIDHVIGFFRIWAISKEEKATHGHFIPEKPEEWLHQGKKLLRMLIENSPMLPIAEDLGLIPEGVREILKAFGICGTKVMRWERRWKSDGNFIPFSYYEPISLTCVSTHDTETLSLWWKNCKSEAELFATFKGWSYLPSLSYEQRKEILKASHHTPSLFHINPLQEYLALFPELVSPNPEEERINIPGTCLPTNWTYRFRPSIEEMIAHLQLTSTIKSLLLQRKL